MNNTIAIFIANYTIGNSPSIINLLDLLSEHYCIHLFLSNVQLKNVNILKRQNIEVIDCGKINDRPLTQNINKIYLSCYDSYISFDPHGFVLCKELFPDAKSIYYSLELYMKNDHFGLDYPKYIMDKERKEIKIIKGLIIQSKEKENLFRKNYHLSDEIPSLILPVTYKGLSVKERSLTIREKHQIDRHKRIALHLGGIAEWFSCIELAVTFSKLKNWVLFFQGYSDQKYLTLLKGVLSKYNITNVIISKETYDDIEDVNRIIMSCDVGIAWYNDISTGFRTAGKSSGKIAAYLRFGLPIVAKKYPSTIEAIEKTGAGVCVDDFIEIPNALSQIDRDYEGYSENARREYDTIHRFGMYRSKIIEFIEGPNNQNAKHHFNWDRLLENKNPEDFLVSKELWGENQGVENPGRVTWRKYLKRKTSNQKVRLLEIGFGAGIDYRALEKEGILDTDKVEYFGADVTQKFVEYARNNLSKMKPYLIDGYSLPFEDKYFDLVYIRHVLEHQTHYRQLLSEALRVSKDEVFIIFFIELSEDASDRISFDGTWYHNTYSRKLFYKFVQELGFDIQELAAFHKNTKTDQVFILTRKSANNQNSQNVHVPDISRKDNRSIPDRYNNKNNCKTAVRFHRNIKAHPEVNKWELSNFVTNNLVPIVGIHPFPVDELLLICSAVVYFNPDIIIEWGTHKGCSARVFYEVTKHFKISTEIHSIDLPPHVSHPENISEKRAHLVQGLPVYLHLGDGLDVAKELLQKKRDLFPLIFVDGDHNYKSVIRELNGIKSVVQKAAVLVHDTFYQVAESNYYCGPYNAVREFANQNGIEVSSTILGLPGMSLLWWNNSSSDRSRAPFNRSDIGNEIKLNKNSHKKQGLSILHTVEFYHPHVGGAEIVVQELSERLVKRGHRVTVATTKLADRTFAELNGVQTEEFDVQGAIARGFTGSDIARYQQFLLKHPADIMMNYAAQQWATDLAFDTLASTSNRRINIIAPCGYSALSDSKTLQMQQFADYFNNVIPAYLTKYDAAVYHSGQYQDYEFAQNHGFNNSVIIPNGVCEEEFSQTPKVAFRQKYKIATKYLGLCVANFYSGKGQDKVIECVRQMNRTDFTMVFIGKEGGQLANLQALATGLNIMFCTNIDRQDVLAAYHEADIFLFGSEKECSPLVIVEAKASQTPFVSTDCGNVRQWKGGIVCATEKMAAYANRILDEEVIHRNFAEEGWKEWKEKLTWESVVDRYEELYSRLYFEKFSQKRTIISNPLPAEQLQCT
ncbi:MAG: CmcI family methyltransferase [Planctomycetota bacterium]|jgi:glycosyltransferase involved in cell wall biosynthesis/ubiquinone/menaquinone biosynthesis C-methylase UbiE/cephalosporin hydroxylase